ncbi:hypothetical protein LAZ67_21000644 [Cordylochernes scorpioides]|uniref:Reverse transcriptase domain-containing protein n=1 Tax=Cordylochernes scorpioides TaxID=51811 RepID=A0ABY6LRA6_9ARAC|nr:hypothetical protein LAZ67_21000644 [Cordylochernes scorpioides]
MAQIQPPETFDFSTPNEWPKWRKKFERYLVVSGMKKKEEADKIDLFMYLMGDRADDIFRTIKFEKEEEATKIDSVLKAFDSHFCVRKNIIYERAKFNSRIQEDREPVDEFITSLYKLADSCEFEGLHEQLIRDRILVGVRNKALSERIQLDSELTLEKAVKMVRQQEAVRQQQVDLQRPSTSQKVNQVKFNSKKQSPKQQQQPSRKKEKSAKTRSRCPKCGGFTHREGQACRAEGQRCNLCSQTSHFANCCPDRQAKTAEVKAVSELDEEISFLLVVSAVEDSSNLDDDEDECRRRWTAEIQVNGKQVKFKLDSQADVTCVPLCLFKKIMGQQRLVESDINIRAAEFSELQTVGMFISTLRNGNYEIKEKMYVIRRLSEPLLSRRACELLKLARRIEVVATRINPIKEFPEVFEGLGEIGNPYEIKLKPGAKPYAVHTPRREPILLMEKLKTRLKELEKAGIIAQVKVATEWCAPTVIAGEKAEDALISFNLTEIEINNYETVVKKFEEHFIGKRNVIFERAQFNRRYQQDGEAVEEYIRVLHKMAEKCNYGSLKEEMIRDRIVVGVKNLQLSEKLQLEPNLTLERAIQAACQTECVKQQQTILRSTTTQAANVDQVYEKKLPPRRFNSTFGKGDASKKSKFQKWSKPEKSGCIRCGASKFHPYKDCPAKEVKCHKCKKVGHFAKVCYNKTVGQVTQGDNYHFVGNIYENGQNSNDWKVYVKVDKIKILFKMDTGADVNIIPQEIYFKNFAHKKLCKPDIQLLGPRQVKLHVIGKFTALIEKDGRSIPGEIFVVPQLMQPLLSGKASESLNLIKRLQSIEKRNSLNPFEEYPKLFTGLGTLQGSYTIKLKDESQPHAIYTPRRIPIPLLNKTKEQLDQMVEKGVIEKVEQPTDWCAPMVIVPKPSSNDLRICVDLTALNKFVKREHYPIPSVEYTLAQMGGAKLFSKLDANSGFWQIPLSEESSSLTTFLTPFGRYRFKRLPFGISSAPEVFQRKMSNLLESQSGVNCHMDDIVIWGATQEEHDERLRCILRKLQDSGLTLNKEKCIFSVKEIKFLGHLITERGVLPDPNKVQAIREFPSPSSISVVRRFLGLVNFTVWVRIQKFAKEYGFHHITSSPRFPQSNGFIESMVKNIKNQLKKGRDPYLSLLGYRTAPLENGYSPAELCMKRKLRTTVPISPVQLQSRIPDLENLEMREKDQRHKKKTHFDIHHRARELPHLDKGTRVWVKDSRVPGVVLEDAGTPRSYIVNSPKGILRINRFHLLPNPQGEKIDMEDEEMESPEMSQCFTSTEDNTTCDSEPRTFQRSPEPVKTRSGRVIKPPDRLNL